MIFTAHHRRTVTGLVTAVLVSASVAVAAPAAEADAVPMTLPTEYVVAPSGGQAIEGIDIGPGGKMYVSSDATGTLFAGSVRSPELAPLTADGTTSRGTSLGVETDGGLIWSVGGATVTVHTRSGRLLTERSVAGGPLGPADLNDLTLTDTAVYATDWANPIIYRAERRGAHVGELEPWIDMQQVIPGFPPQFWLLNGIVADESGATLLVASNGTQAVWRIDTATEAVTQLDLGDQLFGADGMVLVGTTLYAVLNHDVTPGVHIAELDPTMSSGTVTHQVLTDADGVPFRLPTAVAVDQCRLYVVNHETAGPEAPDLISAVPDPTCQ